MTQHEFLCPVCEVPGQMDIVKAESGQAAHQCRNKHCKAIWLVMFDPDTHKVKKQKVIDRGQYEPGC